jgi:hypothetical protein
MLRPPKISELVVERFAQSMLLHIGQRSSEDEISAVEVSSDLGLGETTGIWSFW